MSLKTENKTFHPGVRAQSIHKSFSPRIAKVVVLTFVFLSLPLPPADARTFNPNNILTDQEMFDKDSLSQAAIQNFLNQKNSVLARFSQIVDGQTMTAAEMIYEISQEHIINPKFLLATLEKEQSLISRPTATEKALDWATGYSCFGGDCNEKHKGFHNQVEATAETQRIYIQKRGQFAFDVNKTTRTTDGFQLTPQNQATTNLFIYTPYVGYSPELGVTAPYGGNRLFWRIWSRYFTEQKFLDGQVLRSGGSYYLIENNTKRRFASYDIFSADYKDSDAIVVGTKELAAYPDGSEVLFPNNKVVYGTPSGQHYLLTDGVRRPITDESIALALTDAISIAVGTGSVTTVSDQQIADYPLGSLITTASTSPQGKLVRADNGTVWLVRDNLRHLVHPPVLQTRYAGVEPNQAPGNLESVPTGEPIRLRDGTFVTHGGRYYLISQGDRMRIENTGVFNRVFGPDKQQQAIAISSALLNVHGAGEIIEYIDDTIQDPVGVPSPAGPAGNLAAVFEQMLPDGLIMLSGQAANVSFVFKNTGGAAWNAGELWLEVTDRGAETSSFGSPEQITFSEGSVSSGQSATFSFDLMAPGKVGLHTLNFTLYANRGGSPTQLAQIGKFVIVKPSEGGQIVEQNLPVAVRNNWRPVEVTVKIKNTSPELTWLSRRAALEVYNDNGSPSVFYDSNDWVRREVAAVPINKSSIAPGEVGEFKFTIDPRGVARGTHNLVFKLHLLDQNKTILLDGNDEWVRLLRVD